METLVATKEFKGAPRTTRLQIYNFSISPFFFFFFLFFFFSFLFLLAGKNKKIIATVTGGDI